jgi:hypothetical protein
VLWQPLWKSRYLIDFTHIISEARPHARRRL